MYSPGICQGKQAYMNRQQICVPVTWYSSCGLSPLPNLKQEVVLTLCWSSNGLQDYFLLCSQLEICGQLSQNPQNSTGHKHLLLFLGSEEPKSKPS